MLSYASSVRFFRLPPLRNTAASFVRPATLVPLRSTGAAPERASAAPRPAAFVAPCSLGASLAAPVPPKRCVPLAAYLCRVQPRPFSFAPLLGRPPGGSLVGALKRIVFRPLIVATSPRDGHTGACLFGVAAAKRHARRRFGLKPCADSCRAGRAPWRERGAGFPTQAWYSCPEVSLSCSVVSVFRPQALFPLSVFSHRTARRRLACYSSTTYPTNHPK